MLFVVMFGFNPKYDLIGVAAGHLYYFLEDVVPKIPDTEDLKVLRPPKILVSLCEHLQIHDYRLNEEDFIFEEEVANDVAEAENGNNLVGDIIDDNIIDDNVR